jgi:hypothetical protein
MSHEKSAQPGKRSAHSRHSSFLILHFSLLIAALLFAGCPMNAPPVTGAARGWMDPRIFGVWRFALAGSYEECVVSREARFSAEENGGNPAFGSLVFGYDGWGGGFNEEGSDGYAIGFGGDIVYAASFGTNRENNESAGILILKLWPDYPVTWPWWPEQPPGWAERGYRYPDRTYYGVYYLNFKGDGNQIFFAQSSDQKTNYGPTETRTLEEAIEKFTGANINNLLNLDVGDPQTRYNGKPGFPGLEALR